LPDDLFKNLRSPFSRENEVRHVSSGLK
jgi:hypothetical protein